MVEFILMIEFTAAFISALPEKHKVISFYRQIVLKPLEEFVIAWGILKTIILALEFSITES